MTSIIQFPIDRAISLTVDRAGAGTPPPPAPASNSNRGPSSQAAHTGETYPPSVSPALFDPWTVQREVRW